MSGCGKGNYTKKQRAAQLLVSCHKCVRMQKKIMHSENGVR